MEQAFEGPCRPGAAVTEEELLREAKLYGAEAPEELTYGELAETLELGAGGNADFCRGLALVAYRHAALTARPWRAGSCPGGGGLPFWTREGAAGGQAGALPPDDGKPRPAAGRERRTPMTNETGHGAGGGEAESPQHPAPEL